METMKALAWSVLAVGVFLGTALSAAAQTPVGALAIDERRGDPPRGALCPGRGVDHPDRAAAPPAARWLPVEGQGRR